MPASPAWPSKAPTPRRRPERPCPLPRRGRLRIARMDAEALAARIWPGREVELEPLGGGITNHNFKVSVEGEAFVLRIAGADTELLGIDRRAEHAAAQAAGELDVGPEVVE